MEHGKIVGMDYTKTIAIDSSGRLVLPKTIREEAGIKPGLALEIRCRDGRVEINVASREVTIERKGRLLVAVPENQSVPLSSETVEKTREDLRFRTGLG